MLPTQNVLSIVANPAFPVGDAKPVGGVNVQHGHFLAKMYAKTKELGPVRGEGALSGSLSCQYSTFANTPKLINLQRHCE